MGGEEDSVRMYVIHYNHQFDEIWMPESNYSPFGVRGKKLVHCDEEQTFLLYLIAI